MDFAFSSVTTLWERPASSDFQVQFLYTCGGSQRVQASQSPPSLCPDSSACSGAGAADKIVTGGRGDFLRQGSSLLRVASLRR
eukprot:5833431-Pyramimonas_sp.AAC.1